MTSIIYGAMDVHIGGGGAAAGRANPLPEPFFVAMRVCYVVTFVKSLCVF
ncbi:MAG: hypothetical protein FWF88_12950 [Peptococcaceae bacterium]|jgi:hypothetical protein|nr:hypothetical protein [Peptococcaceae bacterium]MDR2736768.1 hypothetical protein [Gracilibacteraceae bacterium]